MVFGASGQHMQRKVEITPERSKRKGVTCGRGTKLDGDREGKRGAVECVWMVT